jgi:hypothetical protein
LRPIGLARPFGAAVPGHPVIELVLGYSNKFVIAEEKGLKAAGSLNGASEQRPPLVPLGAQAELETLGTFSF